MSFEDDLTVWLEMATQAYSIAKGERLAELHGRRPKTFDSRGLHPYSEVWGFINAYTTTEIAEWLAAWGDGGDALSPVSLRRVAVEDAYTEFVNELKETP